MLVIRRLMVLLRQVYQPPEPYQALPDLQHRPERRLLQDRPRLVRSVQHITDRFCTSFLLAAAIMKLNVPPISLTQACLPPLPQV
jgi:hypothetical protein